MIRSVGMVALALVAVWVAARLLYIGPVQDALETTLMWILGLVAISLLAAAMVLVGVAMTQGESRPAWLRFVRVARDVAAVVGAALIMIGLLHYRDSGPRGEILWLVVGLLVLAGAGVVHWWVVRALRRQAV